MIALGSVAEIIPSRAQSQDEEPIPVRAEVQPGPHYVGQSIGLRVVAIAAGERPELIPPRHPDVDVIALGTDVTPISASAIGSVVHESNLYRYDFVIVPRRSGSLLLPSFRASLGDRTGASRPLRLVPKQPPATGRPATFLGGIGPVRVETVARPEAIRQGDTLVFEVRLSGPGARGSTTRPRLPDLDRSGLAPEVEPLPEVVVDVPPARIFPFRLRPTRPGRATLPPVAVATFDPASKRYMTSISSSISIRVDNPPRFDPDAVVTLSTAIEREPQGHQGALRWIVAVAAIGLAASVAAVVVTAQRRHRRSGFSTARRFANRLARRIASTDSDSDRARVVPEAMAGYLQRAIGRPEGALTPPEARAGIAQATGSLTLADRAARLISACDSTRYSGRSCAEAATLNDAPALFRELARTSRPEPSGIDPSKVASPIRASRPRPD